MPHGFKTSLSTSVSVQTNALLTSKFLVTSSAIATALDLAMAGPPLVTDWNSSC
jgi:hypothetical protein